MIVPLLASFFLVFVLVGISELESAITCVLLFFFYDIRLYIPILVRTMQILF